MTRYIARKVLEAHSPGGFDARLDLVLAAPRGEADGAVVCGCEGEERVAAVRRAGVGGDVVWYLVPLQRDLVVPVAPGAKPGPARIDAEVRAIEYGVAPARVASGQAGVQNGVRAGTVKSVVAAEPRLRVGDAQGANRQACILGGR